MKHQCREVTRLVLQSQEQALGWRQRLQVRLHLLMCSACRRFFRQMNFMRQAMQTWRKQPGADTIHEPPKTH